MTDNQRVRKLLDFLNLNAAELARSIGYERPDVIYNVLNEKNGLSYNLARRICNVHSLISFNWLYKEEGSMVLSEARNNQAQLLEEPPTDYTNLKLCYTECQAEVARLRAKLEKIENDGCPRCSEKDKSIARLYDLLKEWSSGASRDYRAPDKALDTG